MAVVGVGVSLRDISGTHVTDLALALGVCACAYGHTLEVQFRQIIMRSPYSLDLSSIDGQFKYPTRV